MPTEEVLGGFGRAGYPTWRADGRSFAEEHVDFI